jgi:hypothetical protein
MNDSPRNANTILASIEEAREKGTIWDAYTWLECAQSLEAFTSQETDILLDYGQKIAQLKVTIMDSGKSAAYAKIVMEASEEYKLYYRQKAKLDRIQETIRIAKHMARIKNEEYHQ